MLFFSVQIISLDDLNCAKAYFTHQMTFIYAFDGIDAGHFLFFAVLFTVWLQMFQYGIGMYVSGTKTMKMKKEAKRRDEKITDVRIS